MPASIRPTFSRLLLAASLATLSVTALAGQAQQPRDPCRDSGRSDRPTHCEVREQVIPAPGGPLVADATPNGGISVHGWNRQDVQLQSKVVASAPTEQAAKALAAQVRILTDGGRIRAEGPKTSDDGGWSVSFDLMVPSQASLDLRATNGGISITEVQGRLALRTTNGGISLTRVNGDVHGTTTNGGVHIVLDGAGWFGEGLEAETLNGGVHVELPDGYSAHLVAGTQNGGIQIGFPVTVQGQIDRTLDTDLGRGGPTLRLRTTNGGLTINRRQ